MRIMMSVIVTALLLSVSVSANAELLAESNISIGHGNLLVDDFTSILTISEDYFFYDPWVSDSDPKLLFSFELSEIGTTKTMSLATDGDDFGDFVAFLTDGKQGTVKHQILGSYGYSLRSEDFFIDQFVETNGIDLFGYEVTEIKYTLNDGIETSYPYITWHYYGEPVPEPATISLLALGALVFSRKKA